VGDDKSSRQTEAFQNVAFSKFKHKQLMNWKIWKSSSDCCSTTRTI